MVCTVGPSPPLCRAVKCVQGAGFSFLIPGSVMCSIVVLNILTRKTCIYSLNTTRQAPLNSVSQIYWGSAL